MLKLINRFSSENLHFLPILMKKCVILLFLLCILLASTGTVKPVSVSARDTGAAQTKPGDPIWFSAQESDGTFQTAFTTTYVSNTTIEIEITFAGIWAETYSSPHGNFTRLFLEQYGHSAPQGHPDLPLYTLKAEIPSSNPTRFEVLESSSREVDLAAVSLPTIMLPSQPLMPKTDYTPPWVEPDPIAYQNQGWLPVQTTYLGSSYQQRNHHIQPIQIHPVRYDPHEGKIQLLQSLKLRLSWQAPTLAEMQRSARLADPSFDALQDDELIRSQDNLAVDKAPSAPIGYLIISPDSFINALAPFVNFKQNQGYQVTVASLSEVGSSSLTGIKSYIQNAYDTWKTPPSYLLLVGDSNLIPAWSKADKGTMQIAKKTDLYYATMNGSTDYDPDIFYGRFSVRDIQQLNNIINKTIAYANLDGRQAWVKKASFIASCDSGHYLTAENTHNYVINSYGLPFGYSGSFPNNPQSGGDQLYCVSNSATSSNIINSIDNQRVFVTYSGHGSTDGWGDGNINITSATVRALSNNNVFSLITSFACLTGDFGNDSLTEAFGETWIRQEQKGAIVFLGSADNSYWETDDILERVFYDSFFAMPAFAPRIANPVYDGLNKVRDNYPSYGQYYFESYNILGDPSTQIWLGPPSSDFELQMQETDMNVCTGETVQSPVEVTSIEGYLTPVTLGLVGLPSHTSFDFNPNPALPDTHADMTIAAEPVAAPGLYDITLQGTSASLQHDLPFKLGISNAVPVVPTLFSPSLEGSPYPLDLSFTWQSVEQAGSYHFQLARDSEFTNIIIDEPNLSTATYTPTSALDSSTAYYWRVSANNGCGQSNFSSGNGFYTFSLTGDCQSAELTRTLYQNDFEAPSEDWTSSTWGLSTDRFRSPIQSFHANAPSIVSDQLLASPVLLIPNAAKTPSLQFWQWRNLESDTSGCLDAGILEYSSNSSPGWTQVPQEWFPASTYGYDGLIASRYSNPLGGKSGWCGTESWQKSVIDLSQIAGETASFRYRLGTDSSNGSEGWFIDDFSVRYCQENYSFTINADLADKNGEAGTQVEYRIHIANNGSLDSYHVTLSPSDWNTTTNPGFIENLGFLETGSLQVQVTIPPDAVIDQQDRVTLILTSVNNPELQHSLTLTTTVIQNFYSYLPIIGKE